ncbi:glycosyltransferase family 4 protein [Methylobacterium durans]|uniref:Glycosyltransferase family 1 protein n=1 Tax=Methylobacterium durans TaxID=2202825 RepID=A0A2U8W739_9HYPH|nr:glycosyltransferase family 1 protein [Methylobacterium durans]AWN41418.1 glycosyltransferase family 1 protein [Methylobacterium durans]
MPKIVINGRFGTRALTGVDRVAQELSVALDRLVIEGALPGLDIEVVAPPGNLRHLGLSAIPVRQTGRLTGHAWEQLELPRACRGAWLLNLCNTAPLTVRDALVMLHDAQIYQTPDSYSRAFRAAYRVLLPAAARRCRAVTTVSDFSRRELERFSVVPQGKAVVVPNGGDHIDRIEADPTTLDRHGLSPDSYLLAIGSLSPHKNLATILEAQARQTGPLRRLVIAGGANPRIFAAHGLPACPAAQFIGRVSDAELKALYAGAAALLFPSHFEGFGLPPLEAMRSGSPVIASTAAAVREVCGEAVVYADPARADEWVTRIEDIGRDAGLRARLREAGRAQAARFTWRHSALALIAAIEASGYALHSC